MSPSLDKKIAILLWTLLCAAVVFYLIHTDLGRSLAYWYFDAGHHWLQGQALYNTRGTGFIYFPQAAIFFAPFSLMPKAPAETLWRAISLAVYLYALLEYVRLFPRAEKQRPWIALMSLFTAALAFSSLRNGQMNLLLTGLTLLGLTTIAAKHYWRSAILLTLSVALKPTALVWLLLAFALFSPLRLRLIIAVLIAAILPFILQSPHYALTQYGACWQMLQYAFHYGTSVYSHWAQFFGLLQTFGLTLPQALALPVELVAGLVVLYLSYRCLRLERAQAVILIFALAASYLMLFNPRTENNDYVILAPALAYFANSAWQNRQNVRLGFFVALLIMILGSYSIGHHLTPGYVSWLSPLAALLFAVYLIVTVCVKTRTRLHAPSQ
ncbi:MAG: hypothetical protein COV52_06280 [Gammaproteobacteria bacterium CG11_big_fil_rev_8_21_14_0_20_46_22]|nr:MAG: hypothetical protein COW05_07380 [Gammaproteobacteria bacterium CG12_big_fil_rev_8_21_14_0_65_46_12]PIR11108.1 MAG: hypothetical protein COV52_06280 [Gammaproteobacteria bacterium CG11_big_fil_rev_8_21_14_0_20_46_22]